MRVLQGSINEKRYAPVNVGGGGGEGGGTSTETGTGEIEHEHGHGHGHENAVTLVCTQNSTFTEGDETFIHDNVGYHMIGNVGEDLAISLHLYSPPFEQCRVWKDESNGSESGSSMSCMCDYFSEYGHLTCASESSSSESDLGIGDC